MTLSECLNGPIGRIAWLVTAVVISQAAHAQTRCLPMSQRTGDIGCWITATTPLGKLSTPSVSWHLDSYATRADAERAKGPRGTVVESFGRTWLFTIAEAGWHPAHGVRIAEIGPLPIAEDVNYTAQYMEAIFTPGMTAPPHRHPGPEAWYTLSGETCLETPEGKTVGKAGGQYVVVPGGPPMHLTATGSEMRRAVVLILHDSSQPATILAHDWTPKGLCSN